LEEEGLKAQLKLLEELQRHDARIQELEGARRAIPAKLDALRVDLTKIEELLGRERAELEDAERFRRDKETEAKTAESQLAKAKHKLAQVKNSKEYMATQREVESTRKMVAETEEKLLGLIEAAEQARKKISGHEGDVVKLREHFATDEREAQAKLAGIDAEIALARDGREVAARAVRADVLKKYGAIRMRRGLAVVAVHNGTCGGCNMNIPPQLFNQLQRGNTVEVCPNCQRIIYWDKLLEDPDGRPTESEPKPAD
jgi:predicted  nucleic acid-binding Zn-ribbon protein